MEIAYTRKTINFFDYDLRRPRRMEFDVARTPALAALYDAGGAARLHALVEAGEAVLPIHPWETPDMCAYRNTTAPSLEATTAFHAKFRSVLDAKDVLEVGDMTRRNADERLERTRYSIGEQDPRLPQYSEKVGEWIGSVAFWLEDVPWSCNAIREQSRYLREIVLQGGHVGAPCLRLCRYWRRNYIKDDYEINTFDVDYNELFVSTVVEARAERPKRHWAKARAHILLSAGIVRYWRHIAAMPGSKAVRQSAKRFKALADAP